MRRMVLVCGLIGLLIGGRADAGPRIPPGEEQRIVDEHLAAPRHYDIYHGKRDRQYLTGVWKLKLEWNYLTKEWIGRNMVDDRSGKAPMVVLKEGVEAPYREIRPGPEHLDVSADLSGWWDVLVPSPWNQGMPYEEPDDRELCDYYVRAKDMYAIGGVGFYRKTFLVPKEKAGLRVVLHFDSVESTCTVWVNGKRVGEHANWRQQGSARVPGAFMDYFDLDVTDAIRAGDENVVTVRAYDSGVPFYWETPDPGGITGLVWVEYFPPAYFEKVRVSAPFGEDRLTVDCLPAEGVSAPDHVRVQVRPWESADYAFAGRGNSYRADVDLGPEHDGGWRRFEMAVPRIRSWDVDSPCLYELRILDGQDRAMGIERLGVRTFEAKGTRFYLNGTPVYFFGQNAGAIIPGADAPGSMGREAFNYDNAVRKLLRARKQAGLTSQRVHTGPVHRNAYRFCDEIGLMVRAEWTGSNLRPVAPEQETADYLGAHDLTAAFTADRSAFSPKLRERLARWMDYTGNSPCVVTWSGGNEMAAGDADVRLYCTRLYEFLRDHDPQGRPFAPSSGLHWERGDAELRGKPLPCGYLDYHNYEMIQRRWIGAAKSYTKEYDDLGRIYGGVECPVVLGEWLAHGGMEDRLCVITPEAFDGDGNPTVGGYVKLITDVTKQHEPYSHHRVSREYLARLAVGGSRIARTYQDDAEARARYYQRSIEIFRRDCPREVGYSIHGMSPFILRKVGDKRAAGEYGSPELEALRMAQQPLIAIPDFWQKHIVAEEGLSFTAHVINWSRQDFAGRLHVRLARDGAEAVTDSTMRVQALKVGERVEIPVEMRFGPAAASGEYELLLDLRREGRTVSRNAHRVLVRRRADFAPLDTTRRVALYEVPDGTDTAAGLMASVGIEPRRLSDLGDLSGVDVLVLGRDSLDAAVSRNARTLRQLAEAGGTIVAFEQSVSAKVPWAPALYYESCGPVPNADPLQLRHPIFRDLAPLDFEDWGAEHVVYSSLIQPLGHNVVAGGAGPRTGFAHTSPADFGMVVAEFRMGDGACLLSQLRITTNYETDSAARTVGYNMLRYALASAWDATKIRALEGDEGGVSDEPILSRDEVLLVNFLAKCNRSTADADGSGWFGMRIGLGDLPEGVKLFGGVPFSIRTASTTRPHTAIVLGSSDRHPEPAFPTEMKEVGIWNYVTKLYFLHTSAYTTPDDGEEVLRYVIHYSSGEPAIFPVRNRIEIADWHKAKSHANAKAVWFSESGHGVYLTEWVNPHPDRKVKYIDIVAGDKAYVGVLGITGVLGEASE